ncbi:aldo/keto reductase [Actinoallomurus iriomotensis]|uniref:Oxidoreductase n=1 Tax=Actinoallomurus iriomotensis TaxID=478107 RepID=A0A9W6RG22_9ACTN|nr:aldo/keto reductase [Actinoallomurus iriomotensis]GLY75266.1 oxidoreductase [Actinoallomurus iriomotensis]
MEYSLLGPSGIRVSRICLGTATFGVAPAADDATRLVHAALDRGVNFVDTANSYGHLPHFDRPGTPPAAAREPAEELVGRALHGRRDEVVLATKAGEPVGPGVGDRGLSRRHLFRQLEASLRRLRTDHVDVYYAHHPDPDTPLAQTLRAFDDMVRQGKVRYAALSTYPAWQLTHALWIGSDLGLDPPVCAQVRYNLVDRAVEREVVPAARRFGLSLVAFSPLSGGLLAGEDAASREYAGERRWGGQGYSARQREAAGRLSSLAGEWGQPPERLALAWLLARPGVASAIVGPETPAELDASVAAAGLTLAPEQVAALDEIGESGRDLVELVRRSTG